MKILFLNGEATEAECKKRCNEGEIVAMSIVTKGVGRKLTIQKTGEDVLDREVKKMICF